MKYKLLFVSAILLFCAFRYNGGDDKKVKKNLEDDDSHYTNVGNIGLNRYKLWNIWQWVHILA